MTAEVFEASLKVLALLVSRGTQKEVNLNGNGESFLDPDLPDRVRQVRDVIGNDRLLQLSTNGLHITKELLFKLKDNGLGSLDVSIHSPFHVRNAIPVLKEAKMPGALNMGAVMSPHNWAGQIEPEYSYPGAMPNLKCDPLIEGRGYVQSEGNLSPCCYDYRNLGVFGTVFDPDILKRKIKIYELCRTCHQQIPTEILRQNQDEQI